MKLKGLFKLPSKAFPSESINEKSYVISHIVILPIGTSEDTTD